MTEGSIDGVVVRDLVVHADARGALRELYVADWVPTPAFQQWNLVTSLAGTLRGVHVHPRHSDYLHVISGRLLLGLHDLRPDDPAARRSQMLELDAERPQVAFIPHGVCHGFYFPVSTTYVYGLSSRWSASEENGCRYDDPRLGLRWPTRDPVLSPRDEAPATDYDEMRAAWAASTSRHAESP
ncbi:hypothetical protein EJC49_24685 [Aquibium carbonis]|uniref:dTDP-4-dehydrorhamnose 3,5-epimerase n=1 Tax=Aquibium carbonis TaxID=2495581 RepID=A0A3R9ZHQ5_9HYPH|nr:dTDP-4-dehydrorhamnose 3,5-epimerase family protein [Aquibium carbonis]RST80095.1 hypothetical protein EJC49_24685 [Aquibium carbonis]